MEKSIYIYILIFSFKNTFGHPPRSPDTWGFRSLFLEPKKRDEARSLLWRKRHFWAGEGGPVSCQRLLAVERRHKSGDGKIKCIREELAQVSHTPPYRTLMCVASMLHILGAWNAHPPALMKSHRTRGAPGHFTCIRNPHVQRTPRRFRVHYERQAQDRA